MYHHLLSTDFSTNTAFLQGAFARNTALCLDGRIFRLSTFPVQAGGYADVFEGHFESRKVAIKVLRPLGLQQGKLFRRLWREYLTWSRLSHPNILACLGYSYDFSPESYTLPSLVSPWMENGSVTSYLEKYPNADRMTLLVGIAEGLTYLHTCEPVIIHGDLRAGNILVSDQGIPCLTDFGLSRVLEEIQGMTTSSDLAGSVRWMSPELFSSEGEVCVSVKSDIWAYGMTVLEVMSGERPYSTIKNDIAVLGQIRDGKLPSRPQSSEVLDALDDHVWTTCQHCWSREPSSRPSMQDVTSMLISRVNDLNMHTDQIMSYEPLLPAYMYPEAEAEEGGVDDVAMQVDDNIGLPSPSLWLGAQNTTNLRKPVTTKATYEASIARRKIDAEFVCPVPGCGSAFTRSFNLKGHLRLHNEERPFKCSWPGCGKGFARQHDCKRHEALHLDIRPYTCSGCGKTFARMDALNRHQDANCAAQEPQGILGNGIPHAGNNGGGGGMWGGPPDLDTGIIM